MVHNELQPMDHFQTRVAAPLSSDDLQTVTLLYQPLIGPEAFTLYQHLWTMTGTQQVEYSHYTLMNALSLSINRIFEARAHLEAIGLLRTWRSDSGETRTFYYEVQKPLSPQSFFADPLLSVFLWNKVGDQGFKNLEKRYLPSNTWKSSALEVTRTFTDVFQPNLKNTRATRDIRQPKTQNYEFEHEFDFQLLLDGLSEHLLPRKLLTTDIKQLIAKLAFLYSFSPLDMQKIILLAVEDPTKISPERLKKSCEDYFKLHAREQVGLQSIKTPEVQRENSPESASPKLSKEQEYLVYLEESAPLDVLRDSAGGKEPFPADVELVNRFATVYEMPVGVINVLIQYVMLRTDMKLTKSFAEKIASHWVRKNVKTAKEAMELARKEHTQYMKWKNGETAQSASGKPYKRQEKVPDWLDQKPKASKVDDSIDIEAERQKLLAEISATKGR
ncbi:replication initiation and membrane attachment family protein [Chryseomicrobium aureum]|uniref:replication initiation and membrane attachment family protein n=1 Tax=Chryseomicrobium aureum TaxID=1441723 RepID=UPI00359AB9A2